MKRDIAFRGIRKDTNGWAYGHCFSSWENHYIALGTVNGKPDIIEVYPETVGQYTGLKDKNGKDIYSGDVFYLTGKPMFVEYIDDRCCYVLTTGLGYDTRNCKDLNCDTIFGLEIISNIHDNPELLK